MYGQPAAYSVTGMHRGEACVLAPMCGGVVGTQQQDPEARLGLG